MMKQLVLIYLLVGLLIFALLAVLNYGYGAGYVYIYWRDWQFQSSVWGLILLFILVSLFAQLLWIFARRYLAREQRKKETVLHFRDLHPYEQLGIVWLLDAAKEALESGNDGDWQSARKALASAIAAAEKELK